jgi:hypothetical protein
VDVAVGAGVTVEVGMVGIAVVHELESRMTSIPMNRHFCSIVFMISSYVWNVFASEFAVVLIE